MLIARKIQKFPWKNLHPAKKFCKNEIRLLFSDFVYCIEKFVKVPCSSQIFKQKKILHASCKNF